MWPTKIRELAERTILNPGDREPSKEGGRDLLREGGGSLLEFRSRMFLKAHIHANVCSLGQCCWEMVEALRGGAQREVCRSLGACPHGG